MIYWPAKAPGEVADFAFDFTDALESGETITGHSVTATSVTRNSDAISADNLQLLVWLSGGTLGTPGIVVGTVTTSAGRTYSSTAILPIGEEPVTLDMAKAQLVYEEDDGQDAYILELIQAAREHVEAYTGATVFPSAVEMTFASFDDLCRLTRAPIQSIAQVRYLDANGVLQILDPAVYEFVNVAADQLRPAIRAAYNQKFPSTRRAEDAVRVSAVVGYVAAPRPVLRAILMLVSLWFDNRSFVAVDVRGTPTELPHTVEALLANYRR